MNSKTAIVTGANGGIGYATARALSAKGTHVIIAYRDERKGCAAQQEIQNEQAGAAVDRQPLDLADLSSIRRFVESFRERFDQLHLLINNAGVMQILEHRQTVDGFEMQFGTNHLGHFALTGLLMDGLGRVGIRSGLVQAIFPMIGLWRKNYGRCRRC